MVAKMFGSSQKASAIAAGFLWSMCLIWTSANLWKQHLSNILFVVKLSEPHQAKTMPTVFFRHSSKIAFTIASIVGCQKRVCSFETLPARTEPVSGGTRVQAAFMKSTPCESMAWNHSDGPTTDFSFINALNSAVVVALLTLYLCMAAALMMHRIVVTAPNRLSCQDLMALSKCAIPVADSSLGKGDWPKETTFQPDGGFGFSAWNVSSRTGTVRLFRDGPMN
mmetsp:Transcript_61101/g.177131  ORF Transcript_61101/g.177131 Transcript_61101/m.177131 type:complete len:223 (+) Transcript_61101:954-1622(+)